MLAYKFRLYPNKEEERKLLWTKGVCRKTYDHFLDLYNAGEHDRFKPQADGLRKKAAPVWAERSTVI